MAKHKAAAEGRILISVSVPARLVDEVRRAAKRARLPISTYIRQAAVDAARRDLQSVAA